MHDHTPALWDRLPTNTIPKPIQLHQPLCSRQSSDENKLAEQDAQHLGAITDGSLMPYLTIKGRQKTCSSRVLNHTYSIVHGRTINVLIISDPIQGGIGLCMVLIWFSTSFIAHSMTSLLIGHITRQCSVSVAWSSLSLTKLLNHRSDGRSATTKSPTSSKSAISPRTHLHVLASEKLHALPELHVP